MPSPNFMLHGPTSSLVPTAAAPRTRAHIGEAATSSKHPSLLRAYHPVMPVSVPLNLRNCTISWSVFCFHHGPCRPLTKHWGSASAKLGRTLTAPKHCLGHKPTARPLSTMFGRLVPKMNIQQVDFLAPSTQGIFIYKHRAPPPSNKFLGSLCAFPKRNRKHVMTSPST